LVGQPTDRNDRVGRNAEMYETHKVRPHAKGKCFNQQGWLRLIILLGNTSWVVGVGFIWPLAPQSWQKGV